MVAKMSREDDAIGAWLSAALSDPSVCKEFKDDINAWFDSKVVDKEDPTVYTVEYTN